MNYMTTVIIETSLSLSQKLIVLRESSVRFGSTFLANENAKSKLKQLKQYAFLRLDFASTVYRFNIQIHSESDIS